MRRPIIYYNPKLKMRARRLRNNGTATERIMWSRLKRGRMLGYDFHRQKPIGEYIVDFFCHELMHALEIDGSSHDNKQEYDARRQRKIESMGIAVLRFRNADVRFRMTDVLAELEDWIREKERESSDGDR